MAHESHLQTCNPVNIILERFDILPIFSFATIETVIITNKNGTQQLPPKLSNECSKFIVM